LRQGYKRGRKNETVAKLLVEQEERRNSIVGTNTSGPLGVHDMLSAPGPSGSGGHNQWMDPTGVSPGLMMDWTNHDALSPNHQIRHPDGHVPSPATMNGGSMKSPMTIGFPALDDIVTLDHVRHLISLFFVHVRLFTGSDHELIHRYTQSYRSYIGRLSRRIWTTGKIESNHDSGVSPFCKRRWGM
jgi:hypothetical protein